MPKLSVIIPVYNAENYLDRCLKSIVNQSYIDFEIICINDKSTDRSADILEAFSKKDTRITVVNNNENSGSAMSRNKGLDIASGEYISFVDADDYIDEKYFESMVSKAEETDADIVLNLSIYREIKGKSSLYKLQGLPEIPENGMFVDNVTTIHFAPCMIWARIYKKSFLNKNGLRFFPVRTCTDDVAFNIISTLSTDKTYIFWGEKYNYFINDIGVTIHASRLNNWDSEHLKAYNLVYDYIKEKNICTDGLKLFRVYPFFRVDTEEKFNFYKMFFEKIKNDYYAHSEIYNDLEKYFADSILSSGSLDDYSKKYNKIVTIGFIKKGK